ncbi:MAG: adenylosuccinate lyase [Pirellulaceae bacterium]|jgi:adenylosuccinate lyase|nr:adenylosuccinate lyase [Pirellulaceae bacterium]
MNEYERYRSSLATRNASPQMLAIWSEQRRFTTWRRLWLALAEAQQELGLEIRDEQIQQLREHLDDVDFASAAEHETRLRHDVMAHVYTLGEVAPAARSIIHLGATSQFVVCNTDLLLIREALRVVAAKLANAIDSLANFAQQYKNLPTLGLTHLQPAQPTTVGKRAAVWAHDLSLCLEETEHRIQSLRFRGVKGTTGTQASFLALFGGDHGKVEALDKLVTEKMGYDPQKRFVVTGQTYPRVVDGLVAATLAAVASSAQKFATDMRLLAHKKELEEPAGESQVSSSAMAYKRNPMRCERICGLCRFVIGQAQIPFTTAAEQWLERTLDDSSTRRLSLPEPFLAIDGALDLLINVARGIVVYPRTIRVNLDKELPFLASENLLMAATQRGADRQEVHEIIRRHSQVAGQRVKAEGAQNDLLDRLKSEPIFANVDLSAIVDPAQFVGRSPQQVDAFIDRIVEPIRRRFADQLGQNPKITL